MSAVASPSSFALPNETSLPPIETPVAATVPVDEPAPIVQGPFHYIQRYQQLYFEKTSKVSENKFVPELKNKYTSPGLFANRLHQVINPYDPAAVEKLLTEEPDHFYNSTMSWVLTAALKADATLDHFKFLINHVKNKIAFIDSEQDKMPLEIAFDNNRGDIMQLFLENGASFEKHFRSGYTEVDLFFTAASEGKLSIVQFFHTINFPLDYHHIGEAGNGNTALHWSAECHENDIIAFLLEEGADPKAVNAAGDTYDQHAKKVDEKFSSEAIQALMVMLEESEAGLCNVEELVKDILDVDAPVDKQNNTLLILAYRASFDFFLAYELLARHANPCITNNRGISAFEYKLKKCMSRSEEGGCQELATKFQIDIEACKERILERDRNARQILSEALKGEKELNSEEINTYCEDLLEIDKDDQDGNTLIHHAFQYASPAFNDQSKRIIEVLISMGGNLAIKNHNGQMPLDCTPKIIPKKEDVETIKHLILDNTNLPSFDFNSVSLYTALRSLTICEVKNYHFDGERFLKIISTQFPQLSKLNVKEIEINADTLAFLLQRCPQLTSLQITVGDNKKILQVLSTFDLHNFEYLSLKSVSENCQYELAQVLEKVPNLINLDLSNSHISERILNEFGQWFPVLQNLNLSRCKNVTVLNIISITKSCTKLISLCIPGIAMFEDELLNVVKNIPKLERLYISQLTEDLFSMPSPLDYWAKQLFFFCPNFKYLRVKVMPGQWTKRMESGSNYLLSRRTMITKSF